MRDEQTPQDVCGEAIGTKLIGFLGICITALLRGRLFNQSFQKHISCKPGTKLDKKLIALYYNTKKLDQSCRLENKLLAQAKSLSPYTVTPHPTVTP